jgi:acyl-CoA dehydrogenase|tara:strand:+ start:806 stop:1021 length:216 start_codon:yes stop_codon:yes gene_type:complete
VEANAAKLRAADAAVEATEAAQIAFGGFGYAKEYHVERLVREALLFRIVPASPQMLLSFIAGKNHELPKSY